jgi:DNA-binding CsgD family transcriptional regulator
LSVSLSLLPSLVDGESAQVALAASADAYRAAFLGLLDGLGQAIVVVDRRGRMVYETSRLAAELSDEPERAFVKSAMREAAVAAFNAPANGIDAARPIATDSARYRIGVTVYRDPIDDSAGAFGIALLERRTPRRATAEELRERFGLTAAESRVALLLAEGLDNRAIALALEISWHTARRHTEKVIRKLGVPNRGHVGVALYF